MGEQGASPGPASRARILLAVVVSVLVTVSGAGAVGGVAELAASEDNTLGPLASDSPDQEANQSRERTAQQQFPPGTNESGVTNASALLDAHERVLNNTSYSAELRHEDVLTGYEREAYNRTVDPVSVTVEKGDTGTNATVTARGDYSAYWVTENASAVYGVNHEANTTSSLYTYEEGEVYGDGVARAPDALGAVSSGVVSEHVRAVDYDYRGTVERDGETLYEFASTDGNWSADETRPGPFVQNVSATLLVSEQGVIREFDATVEHVTDNETVTTRTTYSVTGVGETTTTEPAWIAEHLPRFDVRVVDDSRVVALEYTGGSTATNGTLSPSTGVFLYTSGGERSTRLDTAIEPGDTLYLWNETGREELQLAVNEPPAVNDSFAALGGDVAYLVSRFDLASATRGTSSASATIEVRVFDESATTNGTATNETTTAA